MRLVCYVTFGDKVPTEVRICFKLAPAIFEIVGKKGVTSREESAQFLEQHSSRIVDELFSGPDEDSRLVFGEIKSMRHAVHSEDHDILFIWLGYEIDTEGRIPILDLVEPTKGSWETVTIVCRFDRNALPELQMTPIPGSKPGDVPTS